MAALLVLAPVVSALVLRMRRCPDGQPYSAALRARPGKSLPDEGTLGAVRAGLASAAPLIRAEAIDGLVALGDTKGLRTGLCSRDSYVRTRAVKALGPHPGDTLTWRLVPLAWDSAVPVRLAVAEVLAQRTGWLATWGLRHLVSDEDAAVRYAAIAALVDLDREWVVPRLRVVRAADPVLWVRDAAATLLRRCGVTKDS